VVARCICAALGLAAALVLASCGGRPGLRLQQVFSSRSDGVSVRFPDGWILTTKNHNYVPDPALCFDISKAAAQSNIDLRVVEYLPPYFNRKYLSTYQRRPTHFNLDGFRKGDEDWSPGEIESFRDHGRVFLVGLVRPSHFARLARREVAGILDSLTVSPQRHCRPTAGVGSNGVPAPTARRQRGAAVSSVAGFQTSRSFVLGPGRAVRTFALHERRGVILLNRITAPRGALVAVDERIPHLAGAGVSTQVSRTAPSASCRQTTDGLVACTQGEEWCAMPQATRRVRLVKRTGPVGPVRVDFVVAATPSN
jgi:hypothetical protein